MDRSIVFALFFIVVTGVAYYFWQEHEARKVLAGTQVKIPEISRPQVVEKQEQVAIRYPVTNPQSSSDTQQNPEPGPVIVAEAIKLPSLDDSDELIKGHFLEFYPAVDLSRIFIFRDFVRRFVVIVDNLDGRKLATRYLVTKSPEEKFKVQDTETEQEYLLDPGNAVRYQLYMAFMDGVSDKQLLSLYIRYYPLFQQAYEELGYPDRYFNDRLIEIIDHLLKSPEIDGKIRLVQPKVYYQFVDSKLESLSAGQKLFIRIGREHASRVKSRLKNLRRLLTTMAS